METIDIRLKFRVPPAHVLKGVSVRDFSLKISSWWSQCEEFFNAINSTVEVVDGWVLLTAYFRGDCDDAARWAAELRKQGFTNPISIYHKPTGN